jgi:hypothetical protein
VKSEACQKGNRKAVWNYFFDIVYDMEGHRENMVYTKPKQTNTVPSFQEYILVKFVSGCQFMTV